MFDRDKKANIQGSRVFYRRELENNPLVVGVAGSSKNR
jgi:hypothetical protein